MSNYPGYKLEDNVRRKARNTGEELDFAVNKNVKAYSTKPGRLTSSQQAALVAKRAKELSEKIECKTKKDFTKEQLQEIEARYNVQKPALQIIKEESVQSKGISVENVGKFFTDAEGKIWEMQSYCEYPTVTFKQVGSEVTIGGAVGSLNVKDFQVLDETSQSLAKRMMSQVEKT